MKYPKYYTKDGVSICRNTDTTGVLVEIPDSPYKKFPLIMTEVTHPNKERFDERIVGMTETTKDLFEDSVKMFAGRVYVDIDRPMTERSIKKQLEKNNFTLTK